MKEIFFFFLCYHTNIFFTTTNHLEHSCMTSLLIFYKKLHLNQNTPESWHTRTPAFPGPQFYCKSSYFCQT